MDWLTSDLAVRVIIPLSTFVMGVIVTLVTKRAEARRNEGRSSAREAAVLINDWYNQLHSLKVRLEHDANSKSTQKAKSFYIENRIVLPRLLMVRESLDAGARYEDLVQEIDSFLKVVTTFEDAKSIGGFGSRALTCNQIFNPRQQDERYSDPIIIGAVLRALDERVQRVNRLAGRALAS